MDHYALFNALLAVNVTVLCGVLGLLWRMNSVIVRLDTDAKNLKGWVRNLANAVASLKEQVK